MLCFAQRGYKCYVEQRCEYSDGALHNYVVGSMPRIGAMSSELTLIQQRWRNRWRNLLEGGVQIYKHQINIGERRLSGRPLDQWFLSFAGFRISFLLSFLENRATHTFLCTQALYRKLGLRARASLKLVGTESNKSLSQNKLTLGNRAEKHWLLAGLGCKYIRRRTSTDANVERD